MTLRTIDLGENRSLAFRSAGSGAPVVLLHGALTTHADWLDAPFAAFAERGTAIAIDRPGHGASLRPRFAASPQEQAAQVREGLVAAGFTPPFALVGHSFGALVALAWAAQWPAEIERLLLLGPLVEPEVRPLEHGLLAPRALPLAGPMLSQAGRWTVDRAFVRLAQRAMFAPEPPPSDWLARYPWHDVLEPARMVDEGEDAQTVLPGGPASAIDLAAIRAPTAIVAGERDKVADPGRHARTAAQAIPGARLVTAEGVGHMPHHMALAEVLAAFDALELGRAAA